MQVGETFVSEKSGVTLKVAARSSDGTVLATQDGECFYRGVWHKEADGAETESVWAEVWTYGGCAFHGCVDKVSRKVTQVG